ncbi:hypothetical protein [Streptomyces sp. NPDC001502]|uniref:hypothetical protein n=1 Tax=Streptomyces sp. NPDC001502 TaxID=3364578 RepID=UPI0036916381
MLVLAARCADPLSALPALSDIGGRLRGARYELARLHAVLRTELRTEPLPEPAEIAIAFQDVCLVDGTIEENIRLGRPDADEAEVRAAATAARLDEVIERLPDGMGDGCRRGRRKAAGR